MWGLIYEKSLPVLPDPALLQEFRNRFDGVEEIQQAAQSKNSLNLIPQEDVITLKGTKPGRKKVGRAIVNVQEFFILYIKALLAKLGIRRWAPALDEPIDTLYNEACRISAIQTFRQVAVAGAYQYMNINLRFLNNIGLLEATYNHFVHYLQTKIWKRETKESGAYQKDLERGIISKNRQRLQNSRYKFAVAQNLPKRYLKILAAIDAHSDDEFIEDAGYVIKTLPYRSQKATTFMRRVDEEIAKAKNIEGKKSQKHERVEMAFLPNALQSIRGVQHPNEKLGDKKFTEKHWEKATEQYDLSHEIAAEDEYDESNSDFQDIDSDSSSNDGSLSSEDSSMEELGENSNPYDEDEMMEEDSQTHTSQNVGTSKNFGYGYDWENWE
ncbi:hypothetical protein O181_013420 [Austropuccinia psidii MF-1]|uniref:Uncharacterized protein n=1 Tax=Austropuccinia psidii MF-1 TaxID=1389203 RepID=A0A9Q3BYZ5_9BASI|nr:hypothetical protein [Austropuccinia psidii MF-1]